MQMLVSAGFIFLIVLWGMLASLTRNIGWLYLWVVLGLVVFAAFPAFSRYGELKLGSEDEEPEFSAASWFAMLFAAGMPLISTVTSSLPWRPVRAMSGLFNVLAVVATAFGVAASPGLGALQTATILFALPFALVIVLMMIALWRGLRADWIEHAHRERELRRRLRKLVAD